MRRRSKMAARLMILATLGVQARVASSQPMMPSERHPAPIVRFTAEDAKELLHSGVGVVAGVARVGSMTSGILTISNGVLLFGAMAETLIDKGTEVTEERLILISRNKRVLEIMKQDGKLQRGDKDFDYFMNEIASDLHASSPNASVDFFRRAVESKAVWLAVSRVPVEHMLSSFLGKRLGGYLASRFDLGARLQDAGLNWLARNREVTRPMWKRASGIARNLAHLTNRMAEPIVEKAVAVALRAIPSPVIRPEPPRLYLPMPAPVLPPRPIVLVQAARPDIYRLASPPVRIQTAVPAVVRAPEYARPAETYDDHSSSSPTHTEPSVSRSAAPAPARAAPPPSRSSPTFSHSNAQEQARRIDSTKNWKD